MAKKKTKSSRSRAAKKTARKKSTVRKTPSRKRSAAKKKVARKSRKPATRKKPAKKRSKRASKPRMTVRGLEQRVKALEAELEELKPKRRRGLSASAEKTLKFAKKDGSPELTRLSVEGTEVIGYGETEGKCTAAAGISLAGYMETEGSPGDVATISVTNARNEELVLEIPNGRFATVGTYTIWVED